MSQIIEMSSQISDVLNFTAVCRYARRKAQWVVVVCLSGKQRYRSLLLGSCQDGDMFGGRTLRFKDGGCVSVVSLNDDLAMTEPFWLVVVGSHDGDIMAPSDERMLMTWYSQAEGVLSNDLLNERKAVA